MELPSIAGLETEKEIAEYYTSPEFAKLVDGLRALPEYQRFLETLRAKGVDIDGLLEWNGFFSSTDFDAFWID